ncbi:MAG: Unknown protein [uncultured Thiotrichaceae bacterium]|uniref:AB hydrolase-1 domain-containing protein n=1 Tax=uncultured Thiotrichaceae bacterium TaxID=298394 RepID=A0A6S6TH68_9GAMM|nr:MAG: Unknown protein [uncultured Thiotrichaceae bacterium]
MIKINDINIDYTIQGSGQAVLLIHGLGSCKEDWQPQISELAMHYQVIALDLRGHGNTSKPRNGYSIRQFTDDVLAFIDALDYSQIHLIGFSLGGMIAQQFAVDYPQRLSSVVVINATPSVVLDNWQIRKMFWMRLLLIKLRGVKYMAKLIANNNLPAPEQAALREQIEKQFAKNDKAAYFRSTRALMHWDVSPLLQNISCPLLSISSDRDYTPVSAKQALVDAVPNGYLEVIPNARHLLPMEQPEVLNKVLMSWLRNL